MILLLLKSEADCLVLQHRKQIWVERTTADESEHHYRASGLVHRCIADVARDNLSGR